MSHKVQVIVDEAEWPLFQAEAAQLGLSLSAWFREAARERLQLAKRRPRLDTSAALQTFFDRCVQRETGSEPDWTHHKDVMNRSRHLEIT